MAFDIALAMKGVPLIRWIADKASHWLGKPALIVSSGSIAPFAIQTRWEPVRKIRDVADGVVHYFRVSVTNKGRATAKNCQVVLQRIWVVERGVWRSVKDWEETELVWSGRPGVSVLDIHSKQQRYCDVGHVLSNHLQSNLNSVHAPHGRHDLSIDGPRPKRGARFFLDLVMRHVEQPNALQAGRYCLELRAFGEGASPAIVFLMIWFPGDYANLTDKYDSGPLAGVAIETVRRPPEEGSLGDSGAEVEAASAPLVP